MLIGLPASGKTSFHRERFGATHALVSKDLLPRGARQGPELERALAKGASVVVDNTNPRVVDRQPLIALARRFGARVIGYFFPPDVGESLKRNQARTEKRIPKVAIFLAAKRMQRPSLVEGFDELYEVRLAGGGGFEVRSLTT
ncbi:MAG: ATP-binding protein [Myxococcales bacterium]|nr:ATP-binding protein [Myxococcales bacterium]